jgi:hypothetical protein
MRAAHGPDWWKDPKVNPKDTTLSQTMPTKDTRYGRQQKALPDISEDAGDACCSITTIFLLWVLVAIALAMAPKSDGYMNDHVLVYPIGHPEWAYDYPIVGQDMCSPCPYCNYDDVWSLLPTLEWGEKDEVISQEREQLWARLPTLASWHDIFQWQSERLRFLMYTEYYREDERMTEMWEKMSEWRTSHQFDWYDPRVSVCYC